MKKGQSFQYTAAEQLNKHTQKKKEPRYRLHFSQKLTQNTL